MKINNNPNKVKLFFIFLVVIIAILIVAIVYQFVCIKGMEKELDQIKNSSYISIEKINY